MFDVVTVAISTVIYNVPGTVLRAKVKQTGRNSSTLVKCTIQTFISEGRYPVRDSSQSYYRGLRSVLHHSMLMK